MCAPLDTRDGDLVALGERTAHRSRASLGGAVGDSEGQQWTLLSIFALALAHRLTLRKGHPGLAEVASLVQDDVRTIAESSAHGGGEESATSEVLGGKVEEFGSM
eukprot:CAMPEP_0206464568 /NCGR_PEP_ID=MMETSP0324_2-20121206/27296_1 /ASSEMBLY_ACC=CAM_ASM_000836 /TAXON_ID=2866 /ORGANISM="Crypthecodinium cohnii, Strain Seligo" /LENGTH=104 /DNA_ID=CAMNT_0053937229 /DNA_START=838 /DNA_END=1153 /DNA_ORIENTATION=-